MNDQNLKQLMADVAADRLKIVKDSEPGSEEAEAALKEGVTAFEAYTEFVKAEDAHEELVERRNIERRESNRNRIMKGIEIGLVTVAAPVVGYFCNRALAGYLCKAEQFETFTTTAGRSLGKMFKFGK